MPDKGLRHFSRQVCEKVEIKKTTTYNEVADELVAELKLSGGGASYSSLILLSVVLTARVGWFSF